MGKAMSSDPTAPPVHGEILTGVQRRRRWSTTEKIRLVEESKQPGSSVSFVARRYGISPARPSPVSSSAEHRSTGFVPDSQS